MGGCHLLLLSLLAVSALAETRYDGYTLLRLDTLKEEFALIQPLVEYLSLDVWGSSFDWVDILVSPHEKEILTQHLERNNIHYSTGNSNVQHLIDRERYAMKKRNSRMGENFDFGTYHTLSEIEDYLKNVSESDDRVVMESLGRTIEGRDMWQLKINVGGEKDKIVWFDFGIHAREWVTQATGVWGINYLLTQYGKDHSITKLLDTYEVRVMPVTNPDGYEYTHTNDRMWRKNRNTNRDTCMGVDLNRNFDDHFGGVGTSDDKCSLTYRGTGPASEPETQNIQNAILEIADRTVALFSVHSYSQLWMYAYGWTSELPPDHEDLDAFTKIGVDVIAATHGKEFEYGPVSTTIYPAASITVDFAYTAGIVQSHTLELRPGPYAANGFLLPEEEIIPAAEEAWAGMVAAVLSL